MKRTFTIEWPDDYGPMWMNIDNLTTCLRTKEFVGPKVELSVRDVTEETEFEVDIPAVEGKPYEWLGCYILKFKKPDGDTKIIGISRREEAHDE